MLRKVAVKVAWVGRTASMVFGVAATAVAGTGIGAPFNLGQTNTVNRLSSLVGSVDNPLLRVDNIAVAGWRGI